MVMEKLPSEEIMKVEFKRLLLTLFAAYPASKLTEGTLGGYWAIINPRKSRLSWRAIAAGFEDAPRHFVRPFAPSAPELLVQMRAAEKTLNARRVFENAETRPERLLPAPEEPIPEGPMRDEYVRWQAESQDLNLGPNDETPRDIGVKRFAAIKEQLGRMGKR